MKYDVDTQSTAGLLLNLEDEIEKKCFQIKQKKNEIRMRRVFFSCCIFTILITFISLFTGFSIINIAVSLILFQSLALTLAVPFILDLNKEGMLNGKNR
ncbi:MAG: hypothetical protein QME45_09665 [Clostridiales bacterium]|nr:hypothetical protein [Clostridiales bacterium]